MIKKLTDKQCYNIVFVVSVLFFIGTMIFIMEDVEFQHEWMRILAYIIVFALGMLMSDCLKRLKPTK